jgi:hypothetical protein
MEEKTEEQKAEQKEEKKEQKCKKRSVAQIIEVLGKVDRLLRENDMQIWVKNGVYFDTDEYEQARVRLSIVQIDSCGKKES